MSVNLYLLLVFFILSEVSVLHQEQVCAAAEKQKSYQGFQEFNSFVHMTEVVM